jgi:hypothetical protein
MSVEVKSKRERGRERWRRMEEMERDEEEAMNKPCASTVLREGHSSAVQRDSTICTHRSPNPAHSPAPPLTCTLHPSHLSSIGMARFRRLSLLHPLLS